MSNNYTELQFYPLLPNTIAEELKTRLTNEMLKFFPEFHTHIYVTRTYPVDKGIRISYIGQSLDLYFDQHSNIIDVIMSNDMATLIEFENKLSNECHQYKSFIKLYDFFMHCMKTWKESRHNV
jgi:hypothetical protein